MATGTIEITKVSKGKNIGQFRFKLKAANGTNLSPNDTYHNHADLVKTIDKYFPNFEKKDLTKKPAKKS